MGLSFDLNFVTFRCKHPKCGEPVQMKLSVRDAVRRPVSAKKTTFWQPQKRLKRWLSRIKRRVRKPRSLRVLNNTSGFQ